MIISILGRTPIIGIYCLQPEKRKKTKLKKVLSILEKLLLCRTFSTFSIYIRDTAISIISKKKCM